jgi:hypothetical protein
VSAGKIVIDPGDLSFLVGDTGSGGGNCPAIVRAPGGYVVVGKLLDAGTLAGVREVTAAHGKGTGPDETAVFIPDNLIDQIRAAR